MILKSPSPKKIHSIVLSNAMIILIAASSFITGEKNPGTVRYFPIGDSYTIGEGLDANENFPSLLTAHLNQSGIAIELLGNPAKTGWTTQDAIDNDLPLFKRLKPDFSTLLIGVNDWVQGV